MSTLMPDLPLDERTERLEQAVREQARDGWTIESQSATQASLARGKNISHVLHLLLTIITLGLWAVVWVLVAAFGGRKTQVLTVDKRGVVYSNR